MDSKEYNRISQNSGFSREVSDLFQSNEKKMNKEFSLNEISQNAEAALSIYQSENSINNSWQIEARTETENQIFLESFMRNMATSSLDDDALGKKAAEIINQKFSNEDEKYEFLASMAQYLVSNYNDSRNPTANNLINNPDNMHLPDGDLTLKQIVSAAVKQEKFSGGVCNDISENIAIIGKHLFPNQDVLTMTTGTHFATVISDGNTSKVINYGSLSSVKNGLGVNPITLETNTRISKVDENGQLREIALLDTQTGELVESAFQTNKKLLRADSEFSKLTAVVRKVVDSQNKQRNYNVGVAAGDLADQKVLVVAAKFESIKEKSKFYAGLGSSIHERKITNNGFALNGNQLGIHIKLGYEREQIIYKSKSTNLEMTNGVHLSGSTNGRAAGSIDLVNKISFTNQSSSGFKTNINLQSQHTLGPSSWGETTGKTSSITLKNIGGVLQNLNFHYNQISLDVAAEKKITSSMSAGANLNSRISPVGSHVSFYPNLNITKPNGVEIFIFAGYEKNLKGTSTKHNILPETEGGIAGVDVKVKNIIIGGTVKGIGNSPYYNGSVKIPLTSKKRK